VVLGQCVFIEGRGGTREIDVSAMVPCT